MIPSSPILEKTPDDSRVIAVDNAKAIAKIAKEDTQISLLPLKITEPLSEKQLAEDPNLYLSLILAVDHQVLIPSHQVIEIISVSPTQITPIPQVDNPIMGIYSWRGEILWVVDGSALLGDTALCDRNFWSSRYSIFVVRESGEHIGIMVPDVGNLGKRSRFCNHADPPQQAQNLIPDKSPDKAPDKIISCPPIVDLVDRISQLRHQLRATWN
jgi:chemotaxis signal transduction protein